MSTAPLTATGPAPGPVVRTEAVPAAAVGDLLAHLPRRPSVAWVTGAAPGEGLVGWGEAARLEATGAERFSRAHRWWTAWTAAARIEDEARLPGTGPVAFASFAFDPQSPSRSVVVVPAVTLCRFDGQAWLTVVGQDHEAVDARLAEARAGLCHPLVLPDAPSAVRYAEGSRTAPQWQHAVEEAVRRIEAGELDKVVLARDVAVSAPEAVDVRHVLSRLATSYPSCWTYLVDGLVGATPELLVRRLDTQVSSRVLAGTMRRGVDSGRDASLASALLASAKDHTEHRYAVQSVAAALAAHCTDLVVPQAPSLLQLTNVQHLSTDVTGELVDGSSVLALAASLHPTAAVCGTPTERALAVIRELEGMDRGRYAGPVGWMDARGDGEMGIALRCGLLTGETLRLYAGCGIVEGSDPDTELAESQAKLVAMRDALETA